MLEHHGYLAAGGARAVRATARRSHILSVHQDLARRGLHEPVEASDQGRLSRSGEAHDHEDLALCDVEAQVADRRHTVGAFVHFGRAKGRELRISWGSSLHPVRRPSTGRELRWRGCSWLYSCLGGGWNRVLRRSSDFAGGASGGTSAVASPGANVGERFGLCLRHRVKAGVGSRAAIDVLLSG